MSRRLHLAVLLFFVFGSGPLAAEGVAATETHRVQLVVHADEEAAAVAKAVAATYGSRLEAPVAADHTVTMTVDGSVLELLARDPRVRGVDAPDAVAAPSRVLPAVVAPRRLRSEGTATWTTGTYAYDAAGNISAIGADQFTYDGYSRIKTGMAGGQTQEFTYDRWGNLSSIKTGTSTIPLTADTATNRLTAVNGTAVLYDAAGQLVELDDSASYAYDGSGMLISSASLQTNLSNVYLYTASDERIASVYLENNAEVSSAWTFRDASGKVLRRYDKRYESSQWNWV